MPKEILLYNFIFDFTAEELIGKMEEAKAEAIVLRINSGGGNVEDAWGTIAKFKEHTHAKTIKVDGIANSMSAFFLAFAEDVEALNVSSFTLHRASFAPFLEMDHDFMTVEKRERLDEINSQLRAALEAKIDVPKFEEITGVTMDELFSMDDQIDVRLTAAQAKEVGLINKVTQITPEVSAAIRSKTLKIAATTAGIEYKEEKAPKAKKEIKKPEQNSNHQPKSDTMDLETLKSENPDLYKEIFAKGVTAEKDRVGAWMAFNDIDPVAVSEGIKEGEAISATVTAEFARKAMSPEVLARIEKDSADKVETDKPEDKEETEKEKKVAAFEKEVRSEVGLETKDKKEKVS